MPMGGGCKVVGPTAVTVGAPVDVTCVSTCGAVELATAAAAAASYAEVPLGCHGAASADSVLPVLLTGVSEVVEVAGMPGEDGSVAAGNGGETPGGEGVDSEPSTATVRT
jgi:hypothetical protein